MEGICQKLARSELLEIEILVYKEGSEDLNKCKLAVMSTFRYFNNVTTEGGNNMELLSTFRARVIMIILNLLQL